MDEARDEKVCPYCGEAILAVAVKCKHCGEWLDGRADNGATAPPVPVEVDNTVTTEQTGKTYKACQLAGALAVVVGLLMAGIEPVVAGLGLFTGLILLLVGIIGGWWAHG